ncbi:MAG: beta-lactamase family protein [Acidobacteriales bacterium]|nr:beta-lactamase family protein [Terriglobales bacterium]
MTPLSHRQNLVPALDGQTSRFERAFRILESGIQAHAFPAATVAVTYQGQLIALKAFGRFTFDAESAPAKAGTVFDLASVSKVVGTTTAAMLLWERGRLDLQMPVCDVIPEFQDKDRQRALVNVRMLLAHSSGLPAYVRLFENSSTPEELQAAAVRIPLVHAPGTIAEYSDIGFIVLGMVLERLAGEPLDQLLQRELFAPLVMSATGYNPSESLRPEIPPTAHDQRFRYRVIQGEVQDENCFVLGGVAGHAGIFSNAADVAAFAHAVLTSSLPGLRAETIALFTRREASPVGSSRTLGWDTPSAPSQSGRYLSPESFGHLGYTGTSLWIDPVRQLSITLLTNRTWPDFQNQEIKKIRPAFHDAVVEALDQASK